MMNFIIHYLDALDNDAENLYIRVISGLIWMIILGSMWLIMLKFASIFY